MQCTICMSELSDRGQLPLKVRYINFDFDVTVDIMQVLTDTSKSNLMLK